MCVCSFNKQLPAALLHHVSALEALSVNPTCELGDLEFRAAAVPYSMCDLGQGPGRDQRQTIMLKKKCKKCILLIFLGT